MSWNNQLSALYILKYTWRDRDNKVVAHFLTRFEVVALAKPDRTTYSMVYSLHALIRFRHARVI